MRDAQKWARAGAGRTRRTARGGTGSSPTQRIPPGFLLPPYRGRDLQSYIAILGEHPRTLLLAKRRSGLKKRTLVFATPEHLWGKNRPESESVSSESESQVAVVSESDGQSIRDAFSLVRGSNFTMRCQPIHQGVQEYPWRKSREGTSSRDIPGDCSYHFAKGGPLGIFLESTHHTWPIQIPFQERFAAEKKRRTDTNPARKPVKFSHSNSG